MAAPPQLGPLPPGWTYDQSTGVYYGPAGQATPTYPGPTGTGSYAYAPNGNIIAPAAAPVAPATAVATAPTPAATVTPSVTPYTTTTANTATQGPSITGQGLFSATPYLINDQAITGAPAQGAAQDYGLNPVWANLQSALAGNQVGANGQTAIAGNQAALGATLANQANGGGMSPADLQLQAGQQSELANQLALLGSQRGGASGNPALAARMAQEQAAAGAIMFPLGAYA